MLIPISKYQLLYRNNTFFENKFPLNLIILNKINYRFLITWYAEAVTKPNIT